MARKRSTDESHWGQPRGSVLRSADSPAIRAASPPARGRGSPALHEFSVLSSEFKVARSTQPHHPGDVGIAPCDGTYHPS